MSLALRFIVGVFTGELRGVLATRGFSDNPKKEMSVTTKVHAKSNENTLIMRLKHHNYKRIPVQNNLTVTNDVL